MSEEDEEDEDEGKNVVDLPEVGAVLIIIHYLEEDSEASESDFNPIGSDSDTDGDDPWERRGKKGKAKKSKPKKSKTDPFAHLVKGKENEDGSR